MNDTIVFLNSESSYPGFWFYYIQRFELCGFSCRVLSLPEEEGYDGKKYVGSGLIYRCENGFSLEDAVKLYSRVIERYSRPPILIGYSIDGLIVQIMLSQGLGALGVAICPVSTNPFMRRLGAFRRKIQWNGRNPPRRRERLVSLGKTMAPVCFATDNRAPLLLISGGSDQVSPPFVVKHIFRRYRVSAADTYYKNFPKGIHGLIGEKEGKDVVDFIIKWIHSQSFVPV